MGLANIINAVNSVRLPKKYGKVTQVVGLVIRGVGVSSSIGELCTIWTDDKKYIKSEVVGFTKDEVLLMPYGSIQGIKSGDRIMPTHKPLTVAVGSELLGRSLNALGEPIDEIKTGSQVNTFGASPVRYPVHNDPPDPFERKRIKESIATGIRAIDGLNTCGKGQRIGIFAGAGVGKSVLLGMIARNTSADVNVIALVGERGREVRDFIEKDLGEEGLKRSVIVVATSDQAPLLRSLAPSTAMAIAEYFRDQGHDVLLMMDSVTRYAMAEREIGLAIGEPPATKGYTPSVFAKLPKLLERAGTTKDKGTMTGLFTVLVEADDMNDPIGDSVRSILDGHIILSRELAIRNHYPAIDINQSLSRLMVDVTSPEHKKSAGKFRETLATYNDAKDLIDIGAYVKGSNPKIDYALANIDKINNFLRQPIEENSDFKLTVNNLVQLLD
jgi:flagellum-specific ATP synthase